MDAPTTVGITACAAAHRALVQLDAKYPRDPQLQINTAPAHDTVPCEVWPLRNPVRHLRLLLVRQPRSRAVAARPVDDPLPAPRHCNGAPNRTASGDPSRTPRTPPPATSRPAPSRSPAISAIWPRSPRPTSPASAWWSAATPIWLPSVPASARNFSPSPNEDLPGSDRSRPQRGALRGTAEIALAVGAVINRHKMRKHFDLTITDQSLGFARQDRRDCRRSGHRRHIYSAHQSVGRRATMRPPCAATNRSARSISTRHGDSQVS